jgi:hypothetical protein
MSHARALRALVLLLALPALALAGRTLAGRTLAGRTLAGPPAGSAALSYAVAVDPAAQVYRVDVRVSGAAEPAVDLRMPAWQPASYALQPYAAAVG